MSRASTITCEQKPRTRSSSRIWWLSAPVMALTGFIVMLPQSLNQISRWIWSVTGASKPPRVSSSPSAVMRSLRRPDGSPTMILLPKPCRTTPGWTTAQLAWTTPPRIDAAGTAAVISPVGSTACRRVPCKAPPKPCKNHQGTPFMAVSTTVSGRSNGATSRATSRMAGALTATTTRSWGPNSWGSPLARTRWACTTGASGGPLCNCRPLLRSAARVWPRASIDTLQPARASPAPSQPPMAPAPTMQTSFSRTGRRTSGDCVMRDTPCRAGPPVAPGHRRHPARRPGWD